MSETETNAVHPPLPVVHDEAGDTPMWLPLSGLACFVVLSLFVLWRASHPSVETAVEGAEGADAAVAIEVVD